MLAIGDIVLNHIDSSFEIETYEYIYKGESQLNKLTNLFGLENENSIYKNTITTIFNKESKNYVFHNADNYVGLDILLKYTMASNLEIKMNPLVVERELCNLRLRFIHKDVNEWLRRIEFYTIINKKILMYDSCILSTVKNICSNLTSWVIKTENVIPRLYNSSKFTVYSKKELYYIVSTGSSIYYNLLLNPSQDNIIIDISFDSLSYDKKIKASLEQIYVSAINDNILPLLEQGLSMPDNIYDIIMTSYMYNCSNMINYRFSRFLINNYYEIMANYDERIITDRFMLSYSRKQKIGIC